MIDEDGDEDVCARRLVMPRSLWLVLCEIAKRQDKRPEDLAIEAIKAGMGSQTSATLVDQLADLPGEEDDSWLEGL